MKLEEVMKLIDAGYTKDEITSMLTPAPEPEKTPEPEQKPVPAAPAAADTSDAVLQELQELKKAVKAITLFAGSTEPPKEKSVEDVLKKFI